MPQGELTGYGVGTGFYIHRSGRSLSTAQINMGALCRWLRAASC